MENIYVCAYRCGSMCVFVCVGEVKIIARKSFLIKNYAWLVSNVRERWQKNENIMENSDKIALQVKSLKFSGEKP